MQYLTIIIMAVFSHLNSAQDPGPSWKPNHHNSLGMHCYSGAPNPNIPGGGHNNGGCGCENTPLRLDGKLYMMESTGHNCENIFPGYNSTTQGDCNYFRIRDMITGMVIANVSASLRHSFFAAVADHTRRMLWVFGSAHARGNKINPNICDIKPTRGCYVGAWNASFDDLTKWSPLRKTVTLPDGYALFNNDVALVTGPYAPQNVSGLPPHQAVMIIEQRTDDHKKYPWLSPFIVNTGSDGDLSKNWVHLSAYFKFDYPKGAAGQGTGGAPTIRFDPGEGYYYSIGGGYITNGPARSRNLTNWTVSPLAPMAIPDVRAARAKLPPTDEIAGLNIHFYTSIWKDGIPPTPAAFAKNLTAWNWGATDPDLCCGDGKAPSYLVNCLSRQGAPTNFSGKTYGFSRIRKSDLSLYEFLRSFFPTDTV